MNKKKLQSNLLLLIITMIWGVAFAAQSVGSEHLGAFSFNAGRALFATVFLLVLGLIKSRYFVKGENLTEKSDNKTLVKTGIICGVILYVSHYLQQLGLKYTTVGKSGFITSLYVVMVPLISTFLGKKSNIKIWISVALAAVGLYLLSITGETGINTGDILTFFCAIAFSVYILIIDKYACSVDEIWFSCIQFFVFFILSLISAVLFENIKFESYVNAFWSVAYAGILSSGVAYTLQIIAQKNTDPTSASLIMSLESVFASVAGMLFLNQFFNAREALGSALVFIAIILSQLSGKKVVASND